MTGLADVVMEMRRREPNAEAVARAVLGDLTTDEQKQAAYKAFVAFVQATCEALRPRAHSVVETAALLGVPDKTVYKMVEDGTLGHVRLGKHIRVPDAEVERLLAAAVAA
ncbi:excisionase family DNA binding protein [Lentzea atacamensis]|uniref:Excisionase family DNA binding protein n=1 Tax=Lentzea atacamensis TaxID=531938 RepID=A0A316I2K4_9PSEU|nr:helix-turn-helix domain-containing protein [Lentzea atacamensis]PWK81649.1 excisionase family DNA binding protein [Lentzea atacamensis]